MHSLPSRIFRRLPTGDSEAAPNSIRDQLRASILDGKLEGGTFLRQEELATHFGTSRIPVREALRQLETEGLIAFHYNRGAVVTSLTGADIIEMFELRLALECHALTVAIPNMAEDDLEQAERLLTTYDLNPTPADISSINWRFHQALYAPCDLPKLLMMIEWNHGNLGRFVKPQPCTRSNIERSQNEHWKIFVACRQGDVNQAVSMLRQHIIDTKKSLAALGRMKVNS